MSGVLGRSSRISSASLSFRQRSALYYNTKRLLDVSLAALLIFIFSPIMTIIAILIKLDSRGSVFYKQPRVGSKRIAKDGMMLWENPTFPCFKFRTMYSQTDPAIHRAYVQALIQNDEQKMAEIQGGPSSVYKLVKDPRVTRVGSILRKYSLDELPQLFNVLRGEMSLVGPRPALKYEVELYKPWHYERLRAQPGITGFQQIRSRCKSNFDDQIRCDLYYIANQSIWLDIQIILNTPLAVLKHDGAY